MSNPLFGARTAQDPVSVLEAKFLKAPTFPAAIKLRHHEKWEALCDPTRWAIIHFITDCRVAELESKFGKASPKEKEILIPLIQAEAAKHAEFDENFIAYAPVLECGDAFSAAIARHEIKQPGKFDPKWEAKRNHNSKIFFHLFKTTQMRDELFEFILFELRIKEQVWSRKNQCVHDFEDFYETVNKTLGLFDLEIKAEDQIGLVEIVSNHWAKTNSKPKTFQEFDDHLYSSSYNHLVFQHILKHSGIESYKPQDFKAKLTGKFGQYNLSAENQTFLAVFDQLVLDQQQVTEILNKNIEDIYQGRENSSIKMFLETLRDCISLSKPGDVFYQYKYLMIFAGLK